MTRHLTRLQLLLAVLAAAGLLVAAGCAKKPRVAEGRLDTPYHHTLRGNDFIDAGNWEQASRSFDLALSLDAEYGPALAGKAVVKAHEATAVGLSAKDKQAKADDARALAKHALKAAKNDDEKRIADVAYIRVYQMTKLPEDWLSDAKDYYDDAVDLDPQGRDPAPPFYMARAYRDAFQMDEAQNLYRKVLAMDSSMTGKADAELAVVQKIIRAEPGTREGRLVAFESSISRADAAALFVEELRLDRLYARGNTKRFDTSFKPPPQTTFKADTIQHAAAATDIKDHPLRADIEEIMKLGVVGLEPDPAHLFHPNEKVTRAEFAMMVEDILVKVTGEQGLKTKFIGQASPFPDVRSDVPYFNAVETVTSRSLMQPKDKINGVFAPLEPVTGADALLVIRLLKDELRSYLR